MQKDELRPGEVLAEGQMPADATLQFIGTVRTPFRHRADCPRQGDPESGPLCALELVPLWLDALRGLERFETVDVLYWLNRARRDLLLQSPRSDGQTTGTFALRSPLRPNPIGLSRAALVGVESGRVLVRGLDCLDGTPLIDLKPGFCRFADRSRPDH